MYQTTEQQIIEAYADANDNDIDIDQLLWTLALNNATLEELELN